MVSDQGETRASSLHAEERNGGSESKGVAAPLFRVRLFTAQPRIVTGVGVGVVAELT